MKHSPFAQTKPPAGSQVDWSHPLAQGLIGFWPGNDGSGGIVNDVVGHNGILQKSLSYAATDRFGSTLRYDGTTTGFAKIVASPDLNPPTISVIGWYTVTAASGDQNIISRPARLNDWSAPFHSWALKSNQFGGSHPSFNIATSGSLTTRSFVASNSINTWNQAAGTFDGVTMRTYFNGVFDNSAAKAGAIDYSLGEEGTAIGSRANGAASKGDFHNGQIGPVMVYGRVLSRYEINWLYQEPFSMLRGPDVYRRSA